MTKSRFGCSGRSHRRQSHLTATVAPLGRHVVQSAMHPASSCPPTTLSSSASGMRSRLLRRPLESSRSRCPLESGRSSCTARSLAASTNAPPAWTDVPPAPVLPTMISGLDTASAITWSKGLTILGAICDSARRGWDMRQELVRASRHADRPILVSASSVRLASVTGAVFVPRSRSLERCTPSHVRRFTARGGTGRDAPRFRTLLCSGRAPRRSAPPQQPAAAAHTPVLAPPALRMT